MRFFAPFQGAGERSSITAASISFLGAAASLNCFTQVQGELQDLASADLDGVVHGIDHRPPQGGGALGLLTKKTFG